MKLSAVHGFAQQQAQGTLLCGWARAARGRAEEGLAQMRQGLEAWEATGAKVLRPYYLALLAEVCGHVGRTDEGLGVLEEAMTAAHSTGERNYEAELCRLRGELLRARSADDRAEACFRRALDMAHCRGAKSPELRAAVSLSRLWRQRGENDTARQILAGVYERFAEGFASADLREAKTLLAASS
jgi:predicted ATPase